MKALEKNLQETKRELVEIFERYDDAGRMTEDFLYLFGVDGTIDYYHPSYSEGVDETNLKVQQTARQLVDFYQSENWTPEDAAYYLISEIYSIYIEDEGE